MVQKENTRVIVVGAAWYGDWAKGFYKAVERLGFKTDMVYNNSSPAPLGGDSDAVTSVFEKAKHWMKQTSPRLFRFLKAARRRLSEYEILWRVGNPDPQRETVIVIFTWTPGTLWVMKKLRAKKGVKLVLWIGESPTRDDSWTPTYDYFDELFMVDEGLWVEELPKKDQGRVHLLPLSSDETIFYPLDKPDEKYIADVSFVGKYIDTRAETLSHLQDYDLKIYGFGWERGFEKFPWLKKYYKGSLPTSDLNLVYNNTKVIIGTLGAVGDPHTTATMRTFDIALAGGFQICENVALTKKIFGDSIPMYKTDEDVVALVKYYLEHEPQRVQYAKDAHAIGVGQSYTCRAKDILRTLGYDY